mmetsp:Transcript_1489/g.5113  ORF Transcript_1489/g.5113 Transcript_1489/m.5113 type:complete len:209 (+) Transcript_1489:1621-2247(+)
MVAWSWLGAYAWPRTRNSSSNALSGQNSSSIEHHVSDLALISATEGPLMSAIAAGLRSKAKKNLRATVWKSRAFLTSRVRFLTFSPLLLSSAAVGPCMASSSHGFDGETDVSLRLPGCIQPSLSVLPSWSWSRPSRLAWWIVDGPGMCLERLSSARPTQRERRSPHVARTSPVTIEVSVAGRHSQTCARWARAPSLEPRPKVASCSKD